MVDVDNGTSMHLVCIIKVENYLSDVAIKSVQLHTVIFVNKPVYPSHPLDTGSIVLTIQGSIIQQSYFILFFAMTRSCQICTLARC